MRMTRRERSMWVKMVHLQKDAENKAVNNGDSTPMSAYHEC